MKKVGILVGREKSFPDALISSINERGKGETVAELIVLGGVRLDEVPGYDLIIDRISHEVPFYRAAMKRFAIEGTIIVNNPFWWSADDKFFNYTLASKLGVAVPRTVLLPQKDYIEGITSDSLRNLQFPLDWESIIQYVGLPAILKPFDGGGWKNVSRVNSLEELWFEYDKTGKLCMTLQEFIDFEQFVRCYCVGQEQVMIMQYDPRKAYLSGDQYVYDPNYLSPELEERVTRDVRTLCTALGYDINTVEFAIKDGVPYAIDFMNPAPDADLHSVGQFYHEWITSAITDLVFKRLGEPRSKPRYRWDAFLNPEAPAKEISLSAIASAAEQAARTITPAPLKEIGEDVVSGVNVIVSEAAAAVSEVVDGIVGTKPTPAKASRKTGPKTGSRSSAKKPAAPRDQKAN
jgi:hypothetical protein